MNRTEFNHMHRIHKQIWWQVERVFMNESQFKNVVGMPYNMLMERIRPKNLKMVALDNLVLCGELYKEEEYEELKTHIGCACCLVASRCGKRCSMCPVKEWRERFQCVQYNALIESVKKFAFVMEGAGEQNINIQKSLHEKYRKCVLDDIRAVREIPWTYDEELYGYGGEDEVGWDD